ncbi:MAG: PRC-barrel domain-containing protein [Candidatus Methylomirabilales bacterium]
MLRRLSMLEGFTIAATDGDIGRVADAYFDDQSWTVRHLVVDTGGWLSGRQVLISPLSLTAVDWEHDRLHAHLTRAQVEGSPSIDTDKPISRQHEMDYYGYYGMPYYWTGPYRWGAWATPLDYGTAPGVAANPEAAEIRQAVVTGEREPGDAHLRSARTVRGYAIRATDGDVGHVEDFLLDDRDWALRYLVVDTRNWLPGKHVLVSPEWIDRISWPESAVHVNMLRETIRSSPEFDPATPPERAYEASLYDYYGRPRYWERERDRAA